MVKVNRIIESLGMRVLNAFAPALDRDPLPDVHPEQARGVVVSFYMSNISRAVVAAQRRVLKRFVPPNFAIEQVLTTETHERALNRFMDTTPYRAVMVLDIDAVPIREGAVDRLMSMADAGQVAGAAQRASHVANGGHLYAGPFCMAVTQETYNRLGRPRFDPTPRGDVAEELTYAAEERGVPVDLLWPTASEDHIWPLTDEISFGHGTVYADDFWHAFEIRKRHHQEKFVRRCEAFAPR